MSENERFQTQGSVDMNMLDEGRKHLAASAKNAINLSFDLIQSYGQGNEGEVVDLCIEAIRSVSIVSGASPEDADNSKSQFLKNYSKLSKSGAEISASTIAGAFKQSLKPEMQKALDSLLNEQNSAFIHEGVSGLNGQKQEKTVRRHRTQGSDFTM